ncbi:putative membrane protein YqiK [Roseospira goensis]|uniref:Putative membrane protein YqiK n=2 Tax=Roseospira goensis TaxID=391922 RepID=A0A7W6S1N0_9PROT|nr:putative membrane protein YqiK [Roseospira goensis]
MARYQAECAGTAGQGAAAAGASQARAHGERCDALAAAIQALDPGDRRAGSADLARPDFYTPGAR